MIKLVNLTEHPVRLVSEEENGGVVFVAPSGDVARVSVKSTPQAHLNIHTEGGVIAAPVVLREFHEVTGLPKPKENTFFVVSSIVLAACPERTDLLAPDTGPESVIRKDGQIVGVRRLTRNASVGNPLLSAMETVRQRANAGRVEVLITDGSRAVFNLLEKHGGTVESHKWTQLCHTDNCAHNSHPDGYAEDVVAIPAAWQEGLNVAEFSTSDEARRISLHFEVEKAGLDGIPMRLLFIIPDEETGPRAVIEMHRGRLWGKACRALFPRKHLIRNADVAALL